MGQIVDVETMQLQQVFTLVSNDLIRISIVTKIRSLLHIRGYVLGLIDADQVPDTNLDFFFFFVSVGDDTTSSDFVYYRHISWENCQGKPPVLVKL